MQKKPIELCLYTVGAAAFGVFVRWLQLQIAFDENGLPDKSFFNYAVPALAVIIAIVFLRFVDAYRNGRRYMPKEFCLALANPGRLHETVRWAAGIITVAGAFVLFAQCETDKNALFLRLLSLAGVLAGVSHPFLLAAANEGTLKNHRRVCLMAAAPILFFSVWLITCYKVNDINPIRWSYAVEIVASCVAIISFYRLAGFAYDMPNVWRAMFFSMMGTVMCIMALADERYLGQQLMLAGAALMQLQYVWILCANLRTSEAPDEETPSDGFERLH